MTTVYQKKRLKIFQEIAGGIKLKYRQNLFGKKALVLFENRMKNTNKFFGRDEYSNAVVVRSDEDLIGKIKEVKIVNGNQNTLFGEDYHKFNKKEYAA